MKKGLALTGLVSSVLVWAVPSVSAEVAAVALTLVFPGLLTTLFFLAAFAAAAFVRAGDPALVLLL